jgi:hypothetical protein
MFPSGDIELKYPGGRNESDLTYSDRSRKNEKTHLGSRINTKKQQAK